MLYKSKYNFYSDGLKNLEHDFKDGMSLVEGNLAERNYSFSN